MEALVIFIAICIGIFALLLYNSFVWGYVTSILYKWFILSSFPTLPHFSIIQFVGFVLFIGAVFYRGRTNIKKEYKEKGSELYEILIAPWLVLFFSWIIYSIFF